MAKNSSSRNFRSVVVISLVILSLLSLAACGATTPTSPTSPTSPEVNPSTLNTLNLGLAPETPQAQPVTGMETTLVLEWLRQERNYNMAQVSVVCVPSPCPVPSNYWRIWAIGFNGEAAGMGSWVGNRTPSGEATHPDREYMPVGFRIKSVQVRDRSDPNRVFVNWDVTYPSGF